MRTKRIAGMALVLLLAGAGGRVQAADAAQADETAAGMEQMLQAAARLDQDPQLRRLQAQWQRQYAQTLEAHLRALAARGSARELYVAALLWPLTRSEDGDAQANIQPAQEQRSWMQAAVAARPRDPWVARFEAQHCAGYAIACDAGAAERFLLQHEADNAEVQLRALAAARRRGDSAAVAWYWQAASVATRYDPQFLPLLRQLGATLRGAALPPLDSRLAGPMGHVLGLGRAAQAQDLADATVMGVAMAIALPAYQDPSSMCSPQQVRSEPGRRDECMSVYALIAADGSSLISPSLGLRKLAELSKGTADAAHWREQLRQFHWIYENGLRLQHSAVKSDGAASPPGHFARVVEDGELVALSRLLQAHGYAATAPAGWLPRDAGVRALLGEAVAPAVTPVATLVESGGAR